MPDLTGPAARRLRGTYTGYGVGCAAVWAVILAAAERRLEPEMRNALRLWCGAWWSGWTSATIGRVAYPPPKRLTSEGEKRLRGVSIGLVGLGFMSVIRLLVTGRAGQKPVGS